jgi:hypothetical protein
MVGHVSNRPDNLPFMRRLLWQRVELMARKWFCCDRITKNLHKENMCGNHVVE